MPSRDSRIDSYIEKQADFARPILEHLRATVHRACPDVEETIKWSMPFFVHRGQLLANMAAFKAHASFGFWRGRDVNETAESGSGMGQFGKLTTIGDLPDDATLYELIRSGGSRRIRLEAHARGEDAEAGAGDPA